ncbi:MAG: hypothetical protein UX57_C0004G0046 [Candidatus Uhrbacteria bacterium GW2011_GWE2_46_68]|uniref:Uncharacterized protein n=2 Tax=Candidatus Uhriibacteriota TaxID=1752732 RepID=A0A0G1Q942_9BACT|nr:MAG: hypothetical protein UX45_C0001G0094 [Candidatus Uhrbacteria bacterium GW2011_GWF2_46_218]KKU41342.1 MAG: hypothetical protein UX57_C0004G0046 [Candidatus Uhrbacteria bacterium GW2011_GWE2_46_68]
MDTLDRLTIQGVDPINGWAAPVHPPMRVDEDFPAIGPILDHLGTHDPLTLEGERELDALERRLPNGPFPFGIDHLAGDVLPTTTICAVIAAVGVHAVLEPPDVFLLHLVLHLLEGVEGRLLLPHLPHTLTDPILAARVDRHGRVAERIVLVVVARVTLIEEQILAEGAGTDVPALVRGVIQIEVVVVGTTRPVVVVAEALHPVVVAGIVVALGVNIEGIDGLVLGVHADRTSVRVGVDEHLDLGGGDGGGEAQVFFLLVVVVVGGGIVVDVLDRLFLVVKREEVRVEDVLVRDLVDRDELDLTRAAGAATDRAFPEHVTFHDAEVFARELGEVRASGIPAHGETFVEVEPTDRVAVEHPHDAVLLGKKVCEREVVENVLISHRDRRVTPFESGAMKRQKVFCSFMAQGSENAGSPSPRGWRECKNPQK